MLGNQNHVDQVKSAWAYGIQNSLLLALPINAFNHISVAGCRFDIGFRASLYKIYEGLKTPRPSALNFLHGLGGHFCKDIPRLGLNSLNFYILYPALIQRYEPMQASLILASLCAGAEVLINPFDTWRVNVQAGEKLTFSLSKLYAGCFLGGVRLFCTWSLYGYFKHHYEPWLHQQQIDPRSTQGITLLSCMLSASYTPFVYPLERIKNHLQYRNPMLKTDFGKQTITAAKEIIQTQGMKGMYRGFGAKVVVNSCFAFTGTMLSTKGMEAAEEEATWPTS